MNDVKRTQNVKRVILMTAALAITTTTILIAYNKKHKQTKTTESDIHNVSHKTLAHDFKASEKTLTLRSNYHNMYTNTTTGHKKKLYTKHHKYQKSSVVTEVLQDQKELFLQKNDDNVLQLVQYYVNIFKHGVRDLRDINVKSVMCDLTANSIDTLQDFDKSINMQQICVMRQEIVKHFTMFYALTLFEDKLNEQHNDSAALRNRSQHMHNALHKYIGNTHILFVADFAMVNLVRAANIDCANNNEKGNILNTAYKYVVSVLSQLAYMPHNSNVAHARSALQKSTALEKLMLNNYLMSLAIYGMIHCNERELPYMANELQVYLGHMIMMNLLSDTNYMLRLCVTCAPQCAKHKAQIVIENMIQNYSAHVEEEDVYDHFMPTVDLILSREKHKFTKMRDLLLQKSHEKQKLQQEVISMAVSLDKDKTYVERIATLLQNFVQLCDSDQRALTDVLCSSYKPASLSTMALQVLHDAWKMENDLYNIYVEHYKLRNLAKQCKLHEQICSTMKMEINTNDLKALKTMLQAQCLIENSDCVNFNEMFETLDVDNRSCDLYDTSSKNRHDKALYTAYSVAQVVRNIANIMSRIAPQ